MSIDSRCTSGGIEVLWNMAEIAVDGWFSFPRILSGYFRQIGSQEKILISAVYRPSIPREQQSFLNEIRTLNQMCQEKYWLLGGDFNMILNLDEKKGGLRREDPDMVLFKDLLTDLHLVDSPTVNGKLTWNNRRGERHQMASRLDRFLASED